MLIGYDLASNLQWTLGGGSVTDWDDRAMTDRRLWPLNRFQWASGAQTTTSTVTLEAVGVFNKPKLAALLDVDLPAGCKVVLQGKRQGDTDWTDYNLGGNSASAVVTDFPDGSRGVVWILDDSLSDLTSILITLYNDVESVAVIPADTPLSVGEFVMCPAFYLSPTPEGLSETWNGADVIEGSGRQPRPVKGLSYREVDIAFNALPHATVYGPGITWQKVSARLAREPITFSLWRDCVPGDEAWASIFGRIATSGIEFGNAIHHYPLRMTLTETPSLRNFPIE